MNRKWPPGSSSATPNLAGNLAEVVAMLVKCGAVRMTGKSGDPTAGDGNGESRDAAAAGVNGPPLLPSDGKVGQIQLGVDVDAIGTGEPARIYRR